MDKFLDPASGDTFQVDLAAKAFGSGGLLGRGPGEGRVKDFIPDSHADFVFAVAGEEYRTRGRLLDWQVTLTQGGQVIGQRKSYLR